MTTYRIKAIFDTFQGEGRRLGTRAVFVRFAGCNLWSGREADREKGHGACARWCDTDFVGGDEYTVGELLAAMSHCWDGHVASERWCVLTGGEPLLQVDEVLTRGLVGAGWNLAVETNGTRTIPRYVDWVCVAPKIGGRILAERADEVKLLRTVDDGWTDASLDWLESRFHKAARIAVPVSGPAFAQNVQLCVAMVKQRPSWSLGVQAHAVWGMP